MVFIFLEFYIVYLLTVNKKKNVLTFYFNNWSLGVNEPLHNIICLNVPIHSWFDIGSTITIPKVGNLF